MTSFNEEFLHAFGWSDYFAHRAQTTEASIIGRVIGEEKSLYRVQYEKDRVAQASVSGKMNYEANSRLDYPAVGDWVTCSPTGDPERLVITSLVERRSVLERAEPGTKGGKQIIASNVDWILIATSLNQDLNLNRLDRYVSLAWSSGASPVIILTKADLAEDLAATLAEVEDRFVGVPVHAVKSLHEDPTAELAKYFARGQTSAIVGSSGVGKSTFVNRILGREAMDTGGIREDDDRGRHTTTSRHLFVTPSGGLLIDTPGMRELQLTDDDEGLSTQFGDIEDLASRCRFSDCEHRTEPGCLVLAALASGALDEDRWESYRKLLREVRHQQRKTDAHARSEELRRWKVIAKAQRAKRKMEE